MHGLEFLQDLAIVMIVAGAVTTLFHRLKQPVVLGYIVAGILVGPHTFGGTWFTDQESIQTLSQLGVILLMFSLGLEFSLRKLSSVGAAAAIAAPLEMTLMMLVGYQLGRLLGWGTTGSVFLGAMLSISSTTVVVKVLHEMGLTKERFAGLIFGILVVEDVLAIVILAVLSGFAATNSFVVSDMVGTLGGLTVFLAVVLVAGLLVVPPLLRSIAMFRSSEMLLVTALGLCFGVSLVAARMGYSVALGAFLIGAVVAETRQGGQVAKLIEPVRDMFTAIFFVAVGMLIDPRMLVDYAGPIVLISAVLVVGKVVGCTAGTFLAGQEPRTALRVGMGLGQIGEFSFIIAQLAASVSKDVAFLYPVAVGVSALTTLTTPSRIRHSDTLVNWFERTAPHGAAAYLQVYCGWVRRSKRPVRASDQIRKLLRRWTLQIGLNMVLVSGLFIAAAWLGGRADERWPDMPNWTGSAKSMVWLAAALVALPLLIASVRKLRAAAMVIAELSVTKQAAGQQTGVARKVVANTILVGGCAGILLWILVLSSAILPPWYVLVGLLLVVAGVGVLMWQSFVRLYAKAQIALHETLAQQHLHDESSRDDAPPLPPLLRDAVLRTVVVADRAPGSGKLIRELALRTQTGASVVGIERDGAAIINPGPDEELRPGDRVLLIGTDAQLASATPLLSAPPPAPAAATVAAAQ